MVINFEFNFFSVSRQSKELARVMPTGHSSVIRSITLEKNTRVTLVNNNEELSFVQI